MIGSVVSDLIEETRLRLAAAAPRSIDEVREAGEPLVAMSDAMHEQHSALKKFLHKHLYSHEKKLEMTREVQAVVKDLFDAYMDDAGLMPQEFSEAALGVEGTERARVVADFIAGMTDRYAITAHESIAG
jgi:dGTPase